LNRRADTMSGEPLDPWLVWSGRELVWSGDGKEYLRGVGVKYLLHPAFNEGFEKLLKLYKPRKLYELCLFIPCSYGKPYSQSFIHYLIQRAIVESGRFEDVHQVILTNAGVVPRELEEFYPYVAYDWNPSYETPEVKKLYVEVLVWRLRRYVERFRGFYKRFACFLRWDSDSFKAVEIVSRSLGVEIPNLAPRTVPPREIEEVSLNGLYRDPDLVLVTPTALASLRDGIRKLLSGER